MRKEYFLNIVCMLKTQLKEEEENYYRELTGLKRFERLYQTKQRIKSLVRLLQSMESTQEASFEMQPQTIAEII